MNTIDIPAMSDERIELAVARHVDILRWDFAASMASTLLEMRPLAESGDKAAGISEGLEMAARTILRLAGIPTDTQEASRGE